MLVLDTFRCMWPSVLCWVAQSLASVGDNVVVGVRRRGHSRGPGSDCPGAGYTSVMGKGSPFRKCVPRCGLISVIGGGRPRSVCLPQAMGQRTVFFGDPLSG